VRQLRRQRKAAVSILFIGGSEWGEISRPYWGIGFTVRPGIDNARAVIEPGSRRQVPEKSFYNNELMDFLSC